MAQAARAELVRLGIAPPYRIVAMSLGAMVTVSWASTWPQEIERAVLINTSLRPFSPFWQRLRPSNYARLLEACAVRRQRNRVGGDDLRRHDAPVADRAACVANWVALREARPVSRRNALRQLLAAMRFSAPQCAPTPLLILSSARDALVDPRCSRTLAQRWGCACAGHPRAGHDLPLDDGDWVIAQIRHWLSASA